jgi:hypothetical protein
VFTEQQLEHIKYVARKKKGQGELSVYTGLFEFGVDYFFSSDFRSPQTEIIKYCAEECYRQHSGEMSVYDMINAWNFISTHLVEYQVGTWKLDLPFIQKIGQLVEPIKNKNGFRTIPIGVGWTDEDGFYHFVEKADWREVPRLLTLLLEAYYEDRLNPLFHYDFETKEFSDPAKSLAETAEDQFYFEYENIHPFVDGNGRSGKILYNYLLGRLDDPVMPPNFWGSSNP